MEADVDRRTVLLSTTAAISGMAGCSGSNQAGEAIVEDMESAKESFEQADRELGNVEGFINQEEWGSAAGAASDAAEAFLETENNFRRAIDNAEELDEGIELVEMLEEYRDASATGAQFSTSIQQFSEAMIDGDRDSAQSHLDRAEELEEEYDSYDLASRSEMQEALEA